MPFGESCYHYETEEPTDKDSAEIICQQGGGSLVSISSSDEYVSVTGILSLMPWEQITM